MLPISAVLSPTGIVWCACIRCHCAAHAIALLHPGVLSRPEAAALLASIPSASRSDVLAQLDPLTRSSTASELRSVSTM